MYHTIDNVAGSVMQGQSSTIDPPSRESFGKNKAMFTNVKMSDGLKAGGGDLIITENAFEEALGTHAGPWPFTTSNKVAKKALVNKKKEIPKLIDTLNKFTSQAPLSTTNQQASTKGSTTGRAKGGFVSVGSIGGPSNFRSRNRSVMLQSESDHKSGQGSTLERIKHG